VRTGIGVKGQGSRVKSKVKSRVKGVSTKMSKSGCHQKVSRDNSSIEQDSKRTRFHENKDSMRASDSKRAK
jgi:hypothetical protein